jgi:hypothetical protein
LWRVPSWWQMRGLLPGVPSDIKTRPSSWHQWQFHAGRGGGEWARSDAVAAMRSSWRLVHSLCICLALMQPRQSSVVP